MRSSDAARRPGRVACAALALAVAFAAGCVCEQLSSMSEAREAWRQCQKEHPYDAERACSALEAEAKATAERYERDAQDAWGCGGVGEGPCDPRDRSSGTPR